MKRILFLLTMILIGVNVSFASNKKEKKDAENMALYEKAVKAVQEKKFVVKFHTSDESSKRRRLDEQSNFVLIDEKSTMYQYDDGRRWYGHNHGGIPNYSSPDLFEGEVTDVNWEIDNKGNVTCSVSTSYEEMRYNNADMKITLKHGSNKCKVIMKKEGCPKLLYYGTIHPIGETEIRKAI